MGVTMMINKNTLFVMLSCRLWHSIQSIMRPIFCRDQQIRCIYNSLTCLDLKIWEFLCPCTTTTITKPITKPITSPHMYACAVKLIGTPVTCCNVAMTANLYPYNYVVGHNSVLHIDQYIPFYYLMAMYTWIRLCFPFLKTACVPCINFATDSP